MSDSDDEEITFHYGTPLQPIEEDEGPPRKKLLQDQADQFAVDSHGRRRFHGAFTGGFSAGYGNSVGTPEGFTPATFKSTRLEKIAHTGQKPEDFMDEEDRSEFGIAPRLLHTQSDFSGQKRNSQRRFHDGAIPGEPVLESLLRPVHETAAVKILKSMGWRPGQGTGERLTADEKKKSKKQHKVYGCQLPSEFTEHRQEPEIEEVDDSDTDSEFEYSTLFAPDDYEPYVLKLKNDRFGLGYSGLSRHSVLGSLSGEYGSQPSGSTSHLSLRDKGRKVSIRGQAFGVGALEEDDDDIYARDDMSNYDFTLGGASREVQKPKTKPQSGVLEGFVKSSKPLPSVPDYPLPALPRDYLPTPRRSRFEHTTEAGRDQGLGRHELSAVARGTLLGETPLPKPTETPTRTTTLAEKPTTSIDNTTTSENKIDLTREISTNKIDATKEDPIAKLLGRNVNFTSQKQPIDNKEQDFISLTNSDQSNVFKPFASNPDKQKRYESYVRDKGSVLARDSGIDRLEQWERNREMVEFEQAAKLYRPLTGFMDDRFTHATQPDDATNPLQAVARSGHNSGVATREQIDAAAKGFFGALTRDETPWRPDALVCRRFNVPDPFSARPEKKKDEKSKVSYSIFEYMETSIHNKESFSKEQSTFSGSKSVLQPIPDTININNKDINTKSSNINSKDDNINNKDRNITSLPSTSQTEVAHRLEMPQTVDAPSKRMTVAELFMKESQKDLEKSTPVAETIEKFDKMELYKAIFLSDSEDEADITKNIAKSDGNEAIDSYADFLEVPKNVERNKSPPRGIFANINFEELNSWSKKADTAKNDGQSSSNDKSIEKTVVNDNSDGKNDRSASKSDKNDNKTDKNDNKNNELNETDIYGPKIPENLQKLLESSSTVVNIIQTDKIERDNDTQFKPKFRSKNERDDDKVIEVNSSSSDSWVEADADDKSKKHKKEKKHKKDKKHKKHKKSKHKKKVK